MSNLIYKFNSTNIYDNKVIINGDLKINDISSENILAKKISSENIVANDVSTNSLNVSKI